MTSLRGVFFATKQSDAPLVIARECFLRPKQSRKHQKNSHFQVRAVYSLLTAIFITPIIINEIAIKARLV